jgi:hypothetical protein
VRDSLLESADVLLLDAEAVIHRILIEDAKQSLKLRKLDALKQPLAYKTIVGVPLEGGQYALDRSHTLTLARRRPPASLPAPNSRSYRCATGQASPGASALRQSSAASSASSTSSAGAS